jgi:ribokinase
LVRVTAPVVDVIDTTGAGDAFIGSFATAIAAGLPELAAVERAVRFASSSVTTLGARGPSVGPAGSKASGSS